MNQGVIIGILTFILWGSASSWWYVCEIKGLCSQSDELPIPTELVPEEEFDKSTTVVAEIEPPDSPTFVPVELSYSIFFEKNSIDPKNPSSISEIGNALADTVGDIEVVALITGHTCDLGTEEYNHKLGLERAKRVGKLLGSQGIDLPFTYESKGETESKQVDASDEERAQSRRVDIDIKSKN